MEWVSSEQADGATSISSMPTHAAGDYLVIAAMKFNGTTIPSLPSGWTSLLTGSGSGRGWRIGYRVASSSSMTSGTWSNATDVNLSVYRGVASIGAVAAGVSGVPALTLTQPGTGWVTVMEVDYPEPPTPAGCVLRDRGDWWRFSDTDGPVSSWAAQTTPARTASIAASIELVPTETMVGGSYGPSWDVEAYVGGSYSPSWDVAELTVGGSYSPSWDVEQSAGGSYSPAWDVLSFGSWRELRLTPEWLAAVADPHAMVSARAELVDASGEPVAVDVRGDQRLDLPLSAARVDFRGETPEQWAADLAFSDPWMVPRDPAHPLWGVSNLRVRLWWRIVIAGTWTEMPVCTVAVGDSSIGDDGTISGTVRGRDMLSTIRGGYPGPLDVSGATVDVALRALFEAVAPTLPVRIAASTVTLPAGTALWEDDPLSDALELAAIGWTGGTVRTDREGVVVCGPRPEPAGPVLDWQEGPDCPVISMQREHGIEHMGNRLTVSSSHADAAGLSVVVQDDDPASPTYVGGPWGVHPLPSISTDKATTEAALRSLGLMHLGRGLHPVDEVEVTVQQRPDLDYRHPVLLGRDQLGVAGVHRVSSWSLTLPVDGEGPALMRVGMMQRTDR